ncbi:MAG: hypothetical protein WCJ64_14335 [Rhodospirillaceae bacterium]
MFCFQCEQTSRGVACTSVGACGKDAFNVMPIGTVEGDIKAMAA